MKTILMWCLLLCTLVSCSKSDDPAPVAAAEQDYHPTSAGSTWSYSGKMPYTITASGKTNVMDGKSYHEFEMVQGSNKGKSYLSKEKGVYTGRGVQPGFENKEIIFLKAEAAPGTTWEQKITLGEGVVNKYVSTLVAKDLTKTVEGKTYKNVIHVSMKGSVEFMDMEIPTVTTDYFFAKGVGMISTEASNGDKYALINYKIK